MPLKQGTETHFLAAVIAANAYKKDAPKAGDGNIAANAVLRYCHANKKDAPKAGDGNTVFFHNKFLLFNKKDAPKAGDGNVFQELSNVPDTRNIKKMPLKQGTETPN